MNCTEIEASRTSPQPLFLNEKDGRKPTQPLMPFQRQHRLAIGVARLDLQLQTVELDARAVGGADVDLDEGRRVLPVDAVETAGIGGDLAGAVPGGVHVLGDRIDGDVLVAHEMLVLHVRLLRHALVDDDADLDLVGVAAAGLRLEQAADRGVGERVGPRRRRSPCPCPTRDS